METEGQGFENKVDKKAHLSNHLERTKKLEEDLNTKLKDKLKGVLSFKHLLLEMQQEKTGAQKYEIEAKKITVENSHEKILNLQEVMELKNKAIKERDFENMGNFIAYLGAIQQFMNECEKFKCHYDAEKDEVVENETAEVA